MAQMMFTSAFQKEIRNATYTLMRRDENDGNSEMSSGYDGEAGDVFLSYFEVEIKHPFALNSDQLNEELSAFAKEERPGVKPDRLLLLNQGIWKGHAVNVHPGKDENAKETKVPWYDCIPEGIRFFRKMENPVPQARFFTRVNTNMASAERTFVHCLIVYEPVSPDAFKRSDLFSSEFTQRNAFVPRAYCLQTRLPIIQTCCDWLNTFYERVVLLHDNDPEMRRQAITSLIAVKMPEPSHVCAIPPIDGVEIENFVAPHPHGLPYLDPCLLTLIEHLGVDLFVDTFLYALLEEKIVFLAERTQFVSEMCVALDALLYPIKWTEPFIPLMNFNQSKSLAFHGGSFFGTTASVIKSLPRRTSIGDCVIVDLDKKEMRISGKLDTNIELPPELRKRLVDDINSCLEDVYSVRSSRWTASSHVNKEKRRAFNNSVQGAFLFMMTNLFSGHRAANLMVSLFPKPDVRTRIEWFVQQSMCPPLMRQVMRGRGAKTFFDRRPYPCGDFFDYCDFFNINKCETRYVCEEYITSILARMQSVEFKKFEQDPFNEEYTRHFASQLNRSGKAPEGDKFSVVVLDEPLSDAVDQLIDYESNIVLLFTLAPAQLSTVFIPIAKPDKDFVENMVTKILKFKFESKEAVRLKNMISSNPLARKVFLDRLMFCLRYDESVKTAWKLESKHVLEFLASLLFETVKICIAEHDHTCLESIVRIASASYIMTSSKVQKFIHQVQKFSTILTPRVYEMYFYSLLNDTLYGRFADGREQLYIMKDFERMSEEEQEHVLFRQRDGLTSCFVRIFEQIEAFQIAQSTVRNVMYGLNISLTDNYGRQLTDMMKSVCQRAGIEADQHKDSIESKLPSHKYIALWVDDQIFSRETQENISTVKSDFEKKVGEKVHVEKFISTASILEWISEFRDYLSNKEVRIVTNRYRASDGGDNAALNLISTLRNPPHSSTLPVCVFCWDKSKIASSLSAFRPAFTVSELSKLTNFLHRGRA